MPSLNVACVLRTNSSSSMPSKRLKSCIGGIVASPTPTVPISGDSMRRMLSSAPLLTRVSAAAAIQPAVPPPTMTIERIGPCGRHAAPIRAMNVRWSGIEFAACRTAARIISARSFNSAMPILSAKGW